MSPPANLYDFTFLAPCPNSGLFIQGNQDDFVPQDQVFKLVEKLRAQRGIEIDYNIIEGANHFFTGKEKELEQSIRAYIDAAPQLLPPEEDEELCIPALNAGLNFIRLATPTTDDARLPEVLAKTSGFVYYVSITGITGSASPERNVVEEAVEGQEERTVVHTHNTAEEAPEGSVERTRLGVRYSELLAFIIAAI